MTKKIARGNDARHRLAAGAKELADVVGATLGPKGRNVVINRGYGQHSVTKDGVTVAKEVSPEGVVERMGAQLLLEASSKTADNVGDGTTTSAVLAGALLSRGLQDIESARFKLDIEAYKRGVNSTLKALVESIKAQAVPAETVAQLVNVATISANNDTELGTLIGEAMHKLGKDGVITVTESRGTETVVEQTEGFQFDRGYISHYMMTSPEKGEATHEDVPILVTDARISSAQDMIELMQKVAAAGHKKLVVIADDVSDEALTAIVVNRMRGSFMTLAVKAPGFGDKRLDVLQDIATVVGAKLISKTLGKTIEDVEFADMGGAACVTSDKDKTTVTGGKGDKKDIEARVNAVKSDLKNSPNEFDKERLKERIGRMLNGIAVLKVGGKTEAEMHEKKFLVEDAVCAVKAAMQGGVVAGFKIVCANHLKVLAKEF
jgi:chaperonin GroEL